MPDETPQRSEATHAEGEGASPQAPSEPQAGRKRRWLWLLPLVLIGVAVFVYTRNAKDNAAKNRAAGAPRAVPIVTATVKQGPIDLYITALGAVTPVYTVTVTSRVQGQIMKVDYQEGQMVHRGQPLLLVDPRPYQAALTQVEGQLAHDQAVLEEARLDLARYQAAHARNAIAGQQLEDQEKVVLQDEGTVKNDQGQVDNAKLNVAYCSIVSPIDGRVGLRLVDPGNIVNANSSTSLVVITQLQPITVILSIAEDYLPQIQAQLRQGHTLEVDAFDRTQQLKIASGSLLTLDNVIDPSTGTIKLKAIFPNQDGALFPSQFVNARLLVSTLQDAHVVPQAAIQRNAQGAFVYVVSAGQTVAMRPVTVGTTDSGNTAVTGVEPGEVVAVNGFDKLVDGAKVRLAGAGGGPGGQGRPGGGGGAAAAGATGHGGKGQGQGHGHRRQQPQAETGQ
jgi:multidrug efflux system membrane fusion protein